MKKIRNPYSDIEGYNCFGCSPGNIQGLQMRFEEHGEIVKCIWSPKAQFQGYHNVLHGGIQATLMDEIASWCVQIKLKTAGVTSNMNVRYKNPVYMDEGDITLEARITGKRRNLADVEVKLFSASGKLCSLSLISYFTFGEKVSKEKFYYPDFDSFYED